MTDKQISKGDSVVAKVDIRRIEDDFPLFHAGERYLIVEVPNDNSITVQGNGAYLESIALTDKFNDQFHLVYGDDPSWRRTPTGWTQLR